ncbi:MAG: DNA/RNA non-specific endonuclease [Armatimonadota bacterium]
MLLGVGALVLGIGGSVLRDRLVGVQSASTEKSLPFDALPVNETRTNEFIQPVAAVIDDETASKLARRADPRMMSYMGERPDFSSGGTPAAGSPGLFFGNLDGASADDHEHRHTLLEHPGLAISYSGQRRSPNWVAWDVTEQDLKGKPLMPRNLIPDARAGGPQWSATADEIINEKLIPLQLCPPQDRLSDKTAQQSTYVITNVVPTYAAVIGGPWQDFEQHIRGLVKQGFVCHVIAGTQLDDLHPRLVPKSNIRIPDALWKAVLVSPPGVRSASDVDEHCQLLVLRVPNRPDITEKRWQDYTTTAAAIEAATGLNLLMSLKPDIAAMLRTAPAGPMPVPMR